MIVPTCVEQELLMQIISEPPVLATVVFICFAATRYTDTAYTDTAACDGQYADALSKGVGVSFLALSQREGQRGAPA